MNNTTNQGAEMTNETSGYCKGNKAGTFLILGNRTIDGTEGYQLKSVNPDNFGETSRGELWLPCDAVTAI